MKKILGFLAQKIGCSCSSRNSRAFIDGWFLGAGITVKAWVWESRPIGRDEFKFGVSIHSRKDFLFGVSHVKSDCRVGRVFAFGYGAIIISHY